MSAASQHRPRDGRARTALQQAIASLRLLFAEIYRSIRPDAENTWLVAAELQMTRRSMRHSGIVIAVEACVVAFSCGNWISRDARWSWGLAVAAVALGVHLIAQRVDRFPSATTGDIRRRALWQTGCVLVCLLAWCSMSVFLWAPGMALDHMFIAVILAASLAGSTSFASIHPATAFVMIATHGAFLITPLALSGLPLDHMLALLASAFILVQIIQTIVLYNSHKKMLTLEHERSDLVEGLRLAKWESDRERARAASAGHAKSQFLSNMNHELRTPMNAILGFSELIKHKSFGEDVDKYAEYAEIIHQSGQHLLSLIDDMLDLAKIDGGKLSLRESDVDLAFLIANLFAENEEKAAEARISLLKQIEPGLPQVYADERALRQIAANLLSNALKYTPPGGCVTLFARREEDGRIAFGVDDTGIGIPEEDQPRAFERFGQGRHDVTTADKGTGLGLAIVKGFTEAHDGEVKLESALGVGTRVTAYLPADRARPMQVRKVG